MHFRQMIVQVVLAVLFAAGPGLAQVKPEEAALEDWAVGILAADWRDGEGGAIDAFDNSLRDLTTAFASAGFDPANITHLSLRPDLLRGETLFADDVFSAFAAQAEIAPAGCLLYFTSHGSVDGLKLGNEGVLSPGQLDGLVDGWCGARPTVVVVSACHSGVFIPAMAAPNRLIMTAARPDRTSFGCSQDDQYPYFDACVLDSLPLADDFIHLASLSRRCVAEREWQERIGPPSEPQTHVGADVEDFFVFLNFKRPGL